MKSHRWTTPGLALVMIASVTLLAGCTAGSDPIPTASADDSDAVLDALHETAIEAGETTVVGYVPSATAWEPLVAAFEERYPDISVEIVGITGAELDARLSAEDASGGILADFANHGEGEITPWLERGWLQSYLPDATSELAEEYIGGDGTWFSSSVLVLGPVYNTTTVSADQAPSSWSDLVSDDWKGRVALSAPTRQSFPQGAKGALEMGLIDEEWLQDYAALEPVSFDSWQNALQGVVNGQAELFPIAPYPGYFSAVAQGAPLGFGWLDEGNVALPQPLPMFADAPHPNAAKLFLSWTLSDQAQALVLDATGSIGTMPGAPLPDGATEIHLVTAEMLNNGGYQEWLAELGRIFG